MGLLAQPPAPGRSGLGVACEAGWQMLESVAGCCVFQQGGQLTGPSAHEGPQPAYDGAVIPAAFALQVQRS